jgi:hypothetical protein
MDNNLKSQKEVAFYGNIVNAWIQTRMELDRTLIYISSAGIGFLITLLANKEGINTTDFLVFLAAFIAFFIVIILCVAIFHRNATHLEALLQNDKAKDRWLDALDCAAKGFFILALFCTLLIGVLTYSNQLYQINKNTGGNTMSENRSKELLNKIDEGSSGETRPSFEKLDEKSLSGLGNLKPDTQTNNDSDNTNDNQNSDKEEK